MNPEEYADGAFNTLDQSVTEDERTSGKKDDRVVVKVVDYHRQTDLESVKSRQHWTLDGYQHALTRFRAKCEQRGWTLEPVMFQEEAYESWKAENGLTGDNSRINVFLLHILGIPNAATFEGADGVCPVVIDRSRPRFWSSKKTSQKTVLTDWQPESATPVNVEEQWTVFEFEAHNTYIASRNIERRIKLQPGPEKVKISKTDEEIVDQHGDASWSFKRISDTEVVWTLHASGSGLFGADNHIKLRAKFLVSPVLDSPDPKAPDDAESDAEKPDRPRFNLFGWRFSLKLISKRSEKRR
jgi:hypothetical protein